MKNRSIKKITAFCAATVITFSMASTCFAGEWKDTKGGKMFIDNGQAVTGMAEIDGDTYYFNSKGIMKTGWLKTKSGSKYYFGIDGIMKTGWLKVKSNKYYLKKDGTAVTGVKKINGSYYCFDKDGVMLTGWQKDKSGHSYYYCTNGKRAVSQTITINGKRVKFDSKGNGKVIKKPDKTNTETNSTKKEVYPTKITVIEDEIPMNLNTTAYVVFSFKPINTTYKDVKYSSSNTSIVSIDKNGKMTAHKAGTCYITITSTYNDSISVQVKVTVS